MDRPARLALAALTLVLVLAPLAAVRPGLPPTFKADEAAYLGMALSLAHDRDLEVEDADVRRLFDEFPFAPVNNLILLSDDGWETAYYGKPYLYSLLAAPAVALAGGAGMVAVNMAMLAALIWLGAAYLARFNPHGLAALTSALFFLLSPAFTYAFWLQPELLMMLSGAACLFLAFGPHKERSRGGARWVGLLAAAGSGAALAVGVYHKPVLAALALPALWAIWRRRGLGSVAAWALAAGLTLGAAAGGATLATGHPSAYLGAARAGVLLEQPGDLAKALDDVALEMALETRQKNSWWWIFRPPDFDAREVVENLRYFVIGRHAGLVPYMPLAVLALALFLVWGRRSPARWLIVAALGAIALFYIIAIPINWHGGGGFVGNRYFAIAYPAFLFLVTRIRPVWTVPAAGAVAALLLGSQLLTPYGAPVPQPTLQAHVRSPLFRYFPIELTVRQRIPGYAYAGYNKLLVMGRRDVFQPPGKAHSKMWIQGTTPVELTLVADRPAGGLLFDVSSPVAGNRVTLSVPGDRRELEFDRSRRQTVELVPSRPSRLHWYKPTRFKPGVRRFVYTLWLETSLAEPRDPARDSTERARFYHGASLDYLGAREQLERPEHYRVEWLAAAVPERAAAAAEIEVPVTVRNLGDSPWTSGPPLAVHLSYHWLDAEGAPVAYEGLRSSFAAAVAPGEAVEAAVRVRTPDTPGTYRLAFDLVREHVAWFSRRGAAVHEAVVEVGPPLPEETAAEPAGPAAGEAEPGAEAGAVEPNAEPVGDEPAEDPPGAPGTDPPGR